MIRRVKTGSIEYFGHLTQPRDRVALHTRWRRAPLTAPVIDLHTAPAFGVRQLDELEQRNACLFDCLAMQIEHAVECEESGKKESLE